MNSNPAVVTLGGDTVSFGSRVDFDDFYRAELPLLVALARALCGAAVADDIAQEAMLAAYRRWRPVGDLEHPEAWVRRTCGNDAAGADCELLRLPVPGEVSKEVDDRIQDVRGKHERRRLVVSLGRLRAPHVATTQAVQPPALAQMAQATFRPPLVNVCPLKTNAHRHERTVSGCPQPTPGTVVLPARTNHRRARSRANMGHHQ
jgi:hypothetical protein